MNYKITYTITCQNIHGEVWTHMDHWGRVGHFDLYQDAEKQAKEYLEDKQISSVEIHRVQTERVKRLIQQQPMTLLCLKNI